METKLGWVLSGRIDTQNNSTQSNYVFVNNTLTVTDDQLQRFWDLEGVGILAKEDK